MVGGHGYRATESRCRHETAPSGIPSPEVRGWRCSPRSGDDRPPGLRRSPLLGIPIAAGDPIASGDPVAAGPVAADDPDPAAAPIARADGHTRADACTDARAHGDTRADALAQPDADSDTDAFADSDTYAEPDAEPDTYANAKPDSDADSDTDAEPHAFTDGDSEPHAFTYGDSDADDQPDADTKRVTRRHGKPAADGRAVAKPWPRPERADRGRIPGPDPADRGPRDRPRGCPLRDVSRAKHDRLTAASDDSEDRHGLMETVPTMPTRADLELVSGPSGSSMR